MEKQSVETRWLIGTGISFGVLWGGTPLQVHADVAEHYREYDLVCFVGSTPEAPLVPKLMFVRPQLGLTDEGALEVVEQTLEAEFPFPLTDQSQEAMVKAVAGVLGQRSEAEFYQVYHELGDRYGVAHPGTDAAAA